MLTDIHLVSDSPAEARSLSEQALALIDRLQAPRGPVQYVVAYVLLSRLNAQLSQAFEPHLRQDTAPPVKVWHALFDSHIGGCGAQMPESVGEALKGLLASVVEHVAEAGRNSDVFGAEVRHAMAGLDQPGDLGADAVLEVARRLLAAGESARERADRLQAQLQASVADAQRLRKELDEQRHAVMHDPLTGLLNRRGMAARMQALMQAGADAAFALLMIDIDHFKQFNDSFGHAVGDAVIRNVAQAIRACLRDIDHAVRYGGEEFLVILPETLQHGALATAEAIRSKVSGLRLVRRRDNLTLPSFSVSVGVAAGRQGEDSETLLQRADAALYQAKQSGRNRVAHA